MPLVANHTHSTGWVLDYTVQPFPGFCFRSGHQCCYPDIKEVKVLLVTDLQSCTLLKTTYFLDLLAVIQLQLESSWEDSNLYEGPAVDSKIKASDLLILHVC